MNKKESLQQLQSIYEDYFLSHLDWLPKKLEKVKSEHFKKLATLELIIGKAFLADLLRLKQEYNRVISV